ncbi:6-bladed beta-propeller [Gracilimonas amylolytica]|uniref:6-bladed beta-propeller n=1 Tax=Gracilimonas amylolytica TaxID=1749045 RepID=UPI000CD7EF8C|nr:6-bladed beta-propeller [Gracilimonas amylolytica]
MTTQVNKTANMRVHIGCLFLIAFTFIHCSQQKPKHVYEIPDHDSFEYISIDSWSGIRNDTTLVELWYDSKKDDGVILSMVTDIMETSNGTYWVTDVTTGKLLEFDISGGFIRELFRKGRGPSEVIRPVSLGKTLNKNEETIYIIDTDQQMILVSDLNGNEKSRYHLKDLPNSFGGNKLTVLNENEFLWPTYRQDFVLSKRDSLGNVTENLIQRIVPSGYQPSMHNNIAYDMTDGEAGLILLYAYQGIPMIMAKIGDDKIMINLEPDSDLESLNTSLELLPLNEPVTVSVLIREVFFSKNTIWVAYKTNLYEIPLDMNSEIIIHTFVDNKGEQVVYQPLFNTGSNIFLVNFNSARIYKALLPDLMN